MKEKTMYKCPHCHIWMSEQTVWVGLKCTVCGFEAATEKFEKKVYPSE